MAEIADKQEPMVDDAESPPLHVQLWRATKNGGGMFTEAFYVFAVGQLGNVWSLAYPQCKKGTDCYTAQSSITWVQVACIIFSQLTFGVIADVFGRKLGGRLTATLLFIGAILITVSMGANPNPGSTTQSLDTLTGQFVMMNVALGIFSLGVGGEYPMSSTMAAERSETEGGLVKHRGRTVALVFAHQGWGNFAFTLIYCFLLQVTNVGGCNANMVSGSKNLTYPVSNPYANQFAANCNQEGLEVTWRIAYAFGLIPITMLIIYRFCCLQEMPMFEARRERYNAHTRIEERVQRVKNLKTIFTNKMYLLRFIGAAGTWYLQDVAFYGNKLFQSTITAAIIGGGDKNNVSLLQNAQFTALVGFVALTGYYFAAFTIDYRIVGRKNMQTMGFFFTSLFFFLCAGLFTQLSKSNIPAFEFLYLAASFFQQYGPNVITWMLPVELFPTDVRAEAQGFCAATGKFGALTASLLFTYQGVFTDKVAGTQNIFWCCAVFMAVGLVINVIFVPDLTGENLHTLDRRFSVDRKA